jgi:hypothetical protein
MMLQYPGVTDVTVASALPGKSYNDLDTQGACRLETQPEDANYMFTSFRVDHHFFDVFNMKVLAGTNFSNTQINSKDVLILNRKAAG